MSPNLKVPIMRLGFLFLSFLLLSACSSLKPGGAALPPPEFVGEPTRSLTPAHGKLVRVEYRVYCTRCEIHYTDSRGHQKEAGEKTAAWRQREDVPTTLRSVSVVAVPVGEGERVTEIQIYVEETLVSEAYLPPGGATDPVELFASVIIAQGGRGHE